MIEGGYSTKTKNIDIEAYIKKIVFGWRESGMTKLKYCRENNITSTEFGYWRRKLNISTSGYLNSDDTAFLSLSASSEIDFLSLSASDEPMQEINSNKLLSVKLPNGLEITFY